MRVGVIGAGYVGLTTAVCLSGMHHVTCIDTDFAKVNRLARGELPIQEPGMAEMLDRHLEAGTLVFDWSYALLDDCDVVFLCVGTPHGADGSADLSQVDEAAETLRRVLRPGTVVAVKSTVPVGTCRKLADRLTNFPVVSNPEFLREGHAVHDFRHPERVVIGGDDTQAVDTVAILYGDAPTFRLSLETAELAKYACNAFLAVKVSYMNSVAELCGAVGADVRDVSAVMGMDSRIGPLFLHPGPGWGGSCLPKDTAELVSAGNRFGIGLPEVEAARETNRWQQERVYQALSNEVGSGGCGPDLAGVRVAVLGVTFKAGTDDLRDSPAVEIVRTLQRAGMLVSYYDPAATLADLPDSPSTVIAAKDADVILLLTEWPEFRHLDWTAIAEACAPGALVVDTRNILSEDEVRLAGLRYLGNGTGRASY
jgi:UDPglucose 6-dehydrogenase